MKIKDYYLDFLNENENFFYVDNQSVGDVKDVSISKKDDYVKIDFETTYGKPASLVAKYSEFKKWYFNNVDKFKDVFQAFVAEYLNKSKEEEQIRIARELHDGILGDIAALKIAVDLQKKISKDVQKILSEGR